MSDLGKHLREYHRKVAKPDPIMNKDKVIEAAKNLVDVIDSSDGENITNPLNKLKKALSEIDKPGLITMDGEYKYKVGELRRVICVDKRGRNPVLSETLTGEIIEHDKYGIPDGLDYRFNIIPVKKEPREWYMFAGLKVNNDHPFSADMYPTKTPPISGTVDSIKVREVLE